MQIIVSGYAISMKNWDLRVNGIPACNVDFNSFKDSAEMAVWEGASYNAYDDAYGEGKCEQDNIEDLEELYGEQFYHLWNKRRNVLLALYEIEENNKQIRQLQNQNEKLFRVIVNPPDNFCFLIDQMNEIK